jgi:hypothetical protein
VGGGRAGLRAHRAGLGAAAPGSLLIGALAALALAGFLGRVLSDAPRDRPVHGHDRGGPVLDLRKVLHRHSYGDFGGLGGYAFERLLNTRGATRTLLDVRFQLCALSAAALVLLPGGVLLPGFPLGAGLHRRAHVAGGRGAVLRAGGLGTAAQEPLVGAMAAIAFVFFGLSYADERALNQVETEMEQAVAQLPPGQRVVSALADPESRINPLDHVVDRICVGRCFSYANYEPSTAQFRVRADHENPFVVSDYGESWISRRAGM